MAHDSMNETLTDHVLRHCASLIAELATSDGQRAPLDRLGDRLFLHLARELGERGLSTRVIADMLGMGLSTYLQKVARLQELELERQSTLSQMVYLWLRGREQATRAEVLHRFQQQDETVLRGLLQDMVTSGLLERRGRGAGTTYRCVAGEGPPASDPLRRRRAEAALVWLTVYRHGPMTAACVRDHTGLPLQEVAEHLRALRAAGSLVVDRTAGEQRYRSEHLVLRPDTVDSRQAAIMDHLDAVFSTIRRRLSRAGRGAAAGEGGATFRFAMRPGYPRHQEVLGLFAAFRQQAEALWARVVDDNGTDQDEGWSEVTLYLGQSVREADADHG